MDPSQGDYVSLAVEDSGEGIPAHLLPRIFEPFYSSKSDDQGFGLGLPMVLGFVRQCGGDVRVWSEPGRGSRFDLLFPAFAEDGFDADEGRVPEGRGRRVLLVDADAEVRRRSAAMLEVSGFEPLEAADPETALDLVRRDPSIVLVITSLTLPGGASGLDVVEEARTLRPGLAVLVASGGRQGPLLERLETSGVPWVRKPFTWRTLCAAAAAAIDPTPGPGVPVKPYGPAPNGS